MRFVLCPFEVLMVLVIAGVMVLLATRDYVVYGCNKVAGGKGCGIVILDTPRKDATAEMVAEAGADAKADLQTIRDTPSPTKKLK